MSKRQVPKPGEVQHVYSSSLDDTTVLSAFSKFSAENMLERLQHTEPDDPIWERVLLISDQHDGVPATRDTVISAMTEARKRTSARVDHAIRRLKQQGLYAQDFAEMAAICDANGFRKTITAMSLVENCLGGIYRNYGRRDQFSEKAWQIGVELAMFDNETELMYSTDLYGPALKRNITSIYLYTILASYATDLTEDLKAHIERINVLDGMAKDFGGFEAAFQTFYDALDAERIRNDLMQEAASAEISMQRGNWEKYRDELEAENRKLRKQLLPLAVRNETLSQQLESAQAGLSEKDKEILRLKDLLDQRDRRISELSASLEQEDLPPIPEGPDIVFIGGHINMVKKLVQAHPNWRFVDGTDPNFAEFQPPRCLFFWDKHLSHPVFHKARGMIRPDTPVVYLKSTNPERLELEMRRGYWANVHQEGDRDA